MRRYLTFVRSHPAFAAGHVIVAVAMLLAVVGPTIAPHDPENVTDDVLASPSAEHLFGTDASGFDVFSQVIAAFRVDIAIAVIATAASALVGVALGTIAGFEFGGRVGRASSWLILRMADMVQALPVFVLALALVGMTGPSLRNVIIAIAFVNAPIFLRLTRSTVLVTQRESYVEAAHALAFSDRRIIARHVLPNSIEPVLANVSIGVGLAILLTSGLSFLGAGVKPPTPEWGTIIANGAPNLVTGEWWVSVLPGIVLAVTVLGFALVGDCLRRYWDRAGASQLDAGMTTPRTIDVATA
ncbi:MAG: ABC transporter permease [Vicinamibacterales bacterium]